jgi:hypothetical protein
VIGFHDGSMMHYFRPFLLSGSLPEIPPFLLFFILFVPHALYQNPHPVCLFLAFLLALEASIVIQAKVKVDSKSSN